MIVAVVISSVLLIAAVGLALYRVERGPSMLDRAVALDVLMAALVGGIVLEAAWSRRTESIVILAVLSLVGFVTSVTIARFTAQNEPPPDEPTPGGAPDDPPLGDQPPPSDPVPGGPPPGGPMPSGPTPPSDPVPTAGSHPRVPPHQGGHDVG